MTQYLNKASTPLHVDILGFVISIKYIEECLYSFLLTVCDISTHNFNVVFESYSLMEGILSFCATVVLIKYLCCIKIYQVKAVATRERGEKKNYIKESLKVDRNHIHGLIH